MTKDIPSIEKIVIRSGLLLSIGFLLYFMLMKIFRVVHYAELRWFNMIIESAVIVLALQYYRWKTGRVMQYKQGIMVGILTSMIGIGLFAAFVYFYLSATDPMLLHDIRTNNPLIADALSPLTASLMIAVEGTVSGIILSIAFMQYYRSETSHPPMQGRALDGQHS